MTKLTWMGEPVSQYGDVVMEPSASSIDLLRASWNFILDRMGRTSSCAVRIWITYKKILFFFFFFLLFIFLQSLVIIHGMNIM